MLDLLLLAIIFFLIARVIWNIFGLFQRLFTFLFRKPTRSTPLQQSPKPSSKTHELKKTVQKTTESLGKTKQKSTQKEISPNISVISKKVEKEQRFSEKVLDKKQSLKQAESSKVKPQNKEELFPVRLQKEVVQQKASPNNQHYQQIIKQLKEQISQLKEQITINQKEKQKYVQTIQEIQQQIVNATEQQSRNGIQENDSAAINQLRDELHAASHRFEQQKNLMNRQFVQEKQSLTKNYQERIQNIEADHEEKTKLYQKTINEVTQKIYQLQKRRVQQSNQQLMKQQGQFQRQSENIRISMEGLKRKIQELAKESNIQKKKYQEQMNSMALDSQKSKIELKNLRQELFKSQNDNVQYQTKYGAQIDSLHKHIQELIFNLQKNNQRLFQVEQQNEELNSKLQSQQFSGERAKKQLSSLQQKLSAQVHSKQELQRKLQQTLDQLRFCQQQLNNLRQTQTDLKKKLVEATESPKKTDRSLKKEDIENTTEYNSLKIENQRLKRKLAEKQQIISRNRTPENQQREASPSFPLEAKTNLKRFENSPLSEQRKIQQTSPYTRPVSNKSPSYRTMSTILAPERRSNTPAEKQPAPVSTIFAGSEVYLGQTQILTEAQRNIIVHQVSAMKKITVKKTRLMFSLRQKSNKSIHEFILGAPNIILLAELQNNKIVGAFTQNAFSRENKFTKSSIVSKAMIFDVSRQVFITNEGQGEIIRCQDHALVWGNREFVLNCEQPITISVNLNCQNSIYTSDYSTFQFLDSEETSLKVTKLQIHRIFLG